MDATRAVQEVSVPGVPGGSRTPLANGQNHRGQPSTVDKTVGSSLTVLEPCRETDVPHSCGWDADDWVRQVLTSIEVRGLDVSLPQSELFLFPRL